MNHINAPDGTPLVYDAYEPARPGVAVLLLHDWQPQPAGPPPADRFVELGTQLQDRRQDVPQVLVGHGFGALVVLRYLETQPGEPPAAAVIASPWLAARVRPAAWKRLAARLADLWPTLPTGRGAAFMTAGARAELQWARRAVLADYQRIERPLLFMLGGADGATDTDVARRFAADLGAHATVQWYPDLPYDLLTTPRVREALLRFLAGYRATA